jgi:hypothetical protein
MRRRITARPVRQFIAGPGLLVDVRRKGVRANLRRTCIVNNEASRFGNVIFHFPADSGFRNPVVGEVLTQFLDRYIHRLANQAC